MRVACCARRRLTEVNLLGLYPRRTISVFDPMEFCVIDVLGARAMQTDFDGWAHCPPSKPSCSKQVSGTLPQILPWGSGPLASFNVSRCGEPSTGDSRSRAYDQARIPRRNAGDVNSSTMKGPQGLSGELLGRRCRNVPRNAIFVPGADEKPWLMGKGCLLCSNP